MNATRTLCLFCAIAVLLAACTESGAPPDEATATASPMSEEISPTPAADDTPGAPPAPPGLPEETWEAILSDLEERLGEPVQEVEVVSAATETWNDGSLGCPKPGEMYTQALIDGFQVVLEVAGEQYDYRVGGTTDVRLCRDPSIEG